jgi:hypothetical protein
MREDRVDAGESLGGINFIEFIFVGAVLYFYGEKAVAREVFERNGCRRVEHTDAQHDVVQRVGEYNEGKDRDDNAAGDLLASHAGSIAEALRATVYVLYYSSLYCFISTGVPILWVEPKRL